MGVRVCRRLEMALVYSRCLGRVVGGFRGRALRGLGVVFGRHLVGVLLVSTRGWLKKEAHTDAGGGGLVYAIVERVG